MDTFRTRIDALKRPLHFIERTQFQKIDSIRNLSHTVEHLVDQALALAPNEQMQRTLQSIKADFRGFDTLDRTEKQLRIENVLRLISTLEEEEHPATGTREADSAFAERIRLLGTPIQMVKGVGPRIAELLKKKGVETVEDALYFVPRTYEDRRTIKPIAEAEPGCRQTLRGRVIRCGIVPYQRRSVAEVVIGDASGTIVAKWFNLGRSGYAYLKRKFKPGQELIFSGKVESFFSQKEIAHPDVELIDDDEETKECLHFNRIVPTYSETEGLNQKVLRRIMKEVVDTYARSAADALPLSMQRRRSLTGLGQAFRCLHFPGHEADCEALVSSCSPYHRRVIFDEFFFLELGLALRRRGAVLEKGIAFPTDGLLARRLEDILPFSLTAAQKRVIAQIKSDMSRPYPMNRLLQGDVGSGKTVVAFAAALVAIGNQHQVVLMAPTELLAEQHYLSLHRWTEALGIRTAFLHSGVKRSDRDQLYRDIEQGEIDLIIGTHAVIQEGVAFKRLGLGIIDEQHRFGVLQRATLKQKGSNPDILVMTATPIPRTLALTVYGDLDISIIDEIPAGRIPINTKVFHEKDRQKVYRLVADEVVKGNRVYIVYPVIEESEKTDLLAATTMFEHLQKDIFPQYRVGLLHGRLRSEEKEAVMKCFKQGDVQILVATTVVEVGIDVPEATLMVIEHAERFGLSQLHQLRGRVGRGHRQSSCVLLSQYKKSDEARRRLKIMEETNDGFRIAEEDLNIRGPGEFLGVRQSGIPDFRIANIIRDAATLDEARQEAFDLVRRDPLLSDPEHYFLSMVLRHRWQGRFALAGVG
ncbi:MAG TPA: ATP-dependent DNA helicase RecG [Thermodesulfobacteriota bacterium]|nr:ATP-dependent DNA helicase RecG [Thermodesulfobacteriota bacterium]